MTDETFPHEIWADLDHWIEGPAASDLRAQGYMKYIRADRIEELEAKLAKAVEVAEKSIKWLRLYGADVHREAAALAELTGGKDE